MPYYTFQPATNTPETGSQYPQVQKMRPGYDYKSPNSVHAFDRAVRVGNSIPDFQPDMDYFILHNNAKASDLLSVAMIGNGFLVSNKLKNILEQFNLPEHKFYQAPVHHKKQILDYYWLQIICDFTAEVDFQASTFHMYQNYNYHKPLGDVAVLSLEDLQRKEEQLNAENPGKFYSISADKIVFRKNAIIPADLFKVGKIDTKSFYISEALRAALIKEQITGCAINVTNLS